MRAPERTGLPPSTRQRRAVYRLHGTQVTAFALQSHLTFTSVNDLVLDHEGSLWIGTDRGVIQLAPRAVAALTEEAGLAETFTVPVLQTRDGALWVGTWGGGLHRFDDGRLTRRITTADRLPFDKIRSLHEADDGTLWIGTERGAAAWRAGRSPNACPASARSAASPNGTTARCGWGRALG